MFQHKLTQTNNMKNSIKLSIAFILGLFFYSNAQVRIGGGVSIDINLPLPEIVVVNRRPAPIPQPRRRRVPQPRPVPAPRPVHTCSHVCVHSLGTINNQNRPDGQYNYAVLNATVSPERQFSDRVFYALDNGETLEFIIQTANPNDFNYHYYQNRRDCHNNMILAVLLNGNEIPVRDGHLSLQPGHHGTHSVINLHTVYDGDFNGTVNF